MRGSFILTTLLAGSLFFTGCAFNTVSNTTIKKETKKSITPMAMPKKAPKRIVKQSKKKIKKIVKDSGVPQYGPNIYRSAGRGPCGSNGCAKTKYDITQDGTTDYPISYRPKRETIIKDIVLVQE